VYDVSRGLGQDHHQVCLLAVIGPAPPPRAPKAPSQSGFLFLKSIYSYHVHDARRLQGDSLPGEEEDQPGEDNRGDALGEKVGARLPSQPFLHPEAHPPSFSQGPFTIQYTKHPNLVTERKKNTGPPKATLPAKSKFLIQHY